MRTFVVSLSLVGTIAATAALLPEPPSAPPAADEAARVTVHLDRALRFLHTYRPDGLSRDQAARRNALIGALIDYRNRAVFPHNHGPEPLALYFVDAHGTPCALASLIIASGHPGIVEAVRARMNDAWVYEIVEDPTLGPVLADWLDAHGLTVADAATIQVPGYTLQGERELQTGYVIASGASLGLSAATTTINLVNFRSGSRLPAWLGLASGAASISLGIGVVNDPGPAQTVAIADVVGGVLAVATSTVRLVRGGDSRDARDETISPEWAPTVGTDERGGARIGLRFVF